MVMNRRGQFFLLAAVIISAVVISLGISANRATVSREPESFYDYSYEVQRETGAVIDYEIYSGFNDGANLSRFVDLLAEDIRDKDPGANFLFIYGDTEDGMNVTNYGAGDANVGGGNFPGSGETVFSSVYYGGTRSEVYQLAGEYDDNVGKGKIEGQYLEEEDELAVEVSGHEFKFPVSRHRKVIFIMQKDVKDESYVSAK